MNNLINNIEITKETVVGWHWADDVTFLMEVKIDEEIQNLLKTNHNSIEIEYQEDTNTFLYSTYEFDEDDINHEGLHELAPCIIDMSSLNNKVLNFIKKYAKHSYNEVLKVSKDEMDDIQRLLNAYSEEGNLYNEFEIEEDTCHYSFNIEFESGNRADIDIRSGQCNCYIDCLVTKPNNKITEFLLSEEDFVDGGTIELEVNDEIHMIKIKAV